MHKEPPKPKSRITEKVIFSASASYIWYSMGNVVIICMVTEINTCLWRNSMLSSAAVLHHCEPGYLPHFLNYTFWVNPITDICKIPKCTLLQWNVSHYNYGMSYFDTSLPAEILYVMLQLPPTPQYGSYWLWSTGHIYVATTKQNTSQNSCSWRKRGSHTSNKWSDTNNSRGIKQL